MLSLPGGNLLEPDRCSGAFDHMKNVKGTTRYKGLHHMDTELYEYGSLQRRPIQILYFDYGRRQRCSKLYRLCDRDIFHLVR